MNRRKISACLCAAFLPACSGAAAQVYVSTGVDAVLASEALFTDVDCALEAPAALYGCGTGGDGEPYRSAGEFASGAGAEIAAGYALSPAIRLELQVAYRPAVLFEGRANFLAPEREQSVRVKGSSLSGVLALEVDLASLGWAAPGGFRGFAGAGIGRVRHRLGETRMRFPRTETTVPGAASTESIWTVTLGVSRALSERTVLDLAWRYADQGEVSTGEGAGSVRWRDGSRTIPLDLAPTHAPVTRHSVGLSVRYGW